MSKEKVRLSEETDASYIDKCQFLNDKLNSIDADYFTGNIWMSVMCTKLVALCSKQQDPEDAYKVMLQALEQLKEIIYEE